MELSFLVVAKPSDRNRTTTSTPMGYQILTAGTSTAVHQSASESNQFFHVEFRTMIDSTVEKKVRSLSHKTMKSSSMKKTEHMFLRFFCFFLVLATALTSALEPHFIRGVSVQKTNLILKDPLSPYCFAAASMATLDPSSNFLATQVWPSARLASLAVKENVSSQWKICEFGCGPGLPSLTAASLQCSVMATDLDEFALELVQTAADEQGLDVKTRRFDLIVDGKDSEQRALQSIHKMMGGDIDLALFSDVFENDAVAIGAAHVTKYFLDRGSRVWTFAQSDRPQREAYVTELNLLLRDYHPPVSFEDRPYDPANKLWLCDLDETKVVYG